jgi:hypothetical protein
VREDAVGRQRGGTRRLTGPYAGYQDLGIGLAGKLDELGAQVLLEGSAGQRRAGGEFVARLIGNIPYGDGRTHSIITQLRLLKCNSAYSTGEGQAADRYGAFGVPEPGDGR